MITTWTRSDHLVMVPKMIRKNLNVPKNRFSLQASSRVTHLWMRILARRENFGPSIRFSAGWQWTWKYFFIFRVTKTRTREYLTKALWLSEVCFAWFGKQIQLFHFHHTNRYFLVSFKVFDQKSEASIIIIRYNLYGHIVEQFKVHFILNEVIMGDMVLETSF